MSSTLHVKIQWTNTKVTDYNASFLKNQHQIHDNDMSIEPIIFNVPFGPNSWLSSFFEYYDVWANE